MSFMYIIVTKTKFNDHSDILESLSEAIYLIKASASGTQQVQMSAIQWSVSD